MKENILAIHDISIRQDAEGRFCLNDLHKAAGGENRHKPNLWMALLQTVELARFLESEEAIAGKAAIFTKQGLGTFVIKELVYAYAMWISAEFHVHVIRAYDAMVTGAVEEELPPLAVLDRDFKAALSLATLVGLEGNQKLLKADKVVRRYHKQSVLNLLEVSLESPVQLILLTPTEIGKDIGLSGRKVNMLLESLGFQIREHDKWIPTERGKKYGVLLDVNKTHSDGTPVQQLKWFSSVVEMIDLI